MAGLVALVTVSLLLSHLGRLAARNGDSGSNGDPSPSNTHRDRHGYKTQAGRQASKARQARQGKARQGKARQGKARQGRQAGI